MAERYDPATIESKWQRHWEENKTFRTPDPGDPDFDPEKPKYYVLDMFPYPSGSGLHVGHPEGYTGTDILARWERMRGKNVLHPMGWDAFGLPAEQYAIQTGTHPAITTARNIETFRAQIKRLGFSYDWDREVNTTDPDYYRWTQWIFRLLHDTWYDEVTDRGRPIDELPIPDEIADDPDAVADYRDSKRLAYLDSIPVWWCPKLGTVLANEEVIDGRSERGQHPCKRLPLRQWMLRITAYAERLLADLDEVEWPEETKKQQRDWIGRSEGSTVWFPLAPDTASPAALAAAAEDDDRVRADGAFKVFTTRPDTLYGATYCVLAPEHPLVSAVTTGDRETEVNAYCEEATRKSDLDRTALSEEKSGVFTGAHAINPVNQSRIPIWVADYVLGSYGAGAIMAVPAHDERDFDFARAHDLPIVTVVEPVELPDDEAEREKAGLAREVETDDGTLICFTGNGVAVHSPWIDGLETPEAKTRMIEKLEEEGLGEAEVTYRLRDWIFSRQRYWGEPFPMIHRQDDRTVAVPESELPVLLPEMEDFEPSGRPEPPLAKATDWVQTTDPETGLPARRETNTMPNWAGSCWYYLRYLDPNNDEQPWDPEKESYWMPVDLYVGGREHAVLHLLYARFWHKVLYDRGYVSTTEPFGRLFHQGLILAFAFEDPETGSLIPSDQVEKTGEETWVRTSDGTEVERIVAKMSKSLKNVVNPDDVIEEYGADTLRCYEMFLGPLEDSKPWNPRDVGGIYRFLGRVWRLVAGDTDSDGPIRSHLLDETMDPDPDLERALHQCIEKVTNDLEAMAFNTAIAAMMVFVNEATPRVDALERSQAERFLLLLAPFAPHIAEELWARLGHEESLAYESWPTWDPELLVEETIEIPVQVNGKVRGRVDVAPDIAKDALEAEAREAVQDQLEGKTVRKVIVVPKKIVNIVVG